MLRALFDSLFSGSKGPPRPNPPALTVSLPDAVHQSSDVNEVVARFQEALGQEDAHVRYWESERETAFYFYGDSYKQMKAALLAVVPEIPLCQGAKIEQIA